MTSNNLNNEYFNWMYQLVCGKQYTKNLSYRKLLFLLHDPDFAYTIALDGNRFEDGIDLRYRFGYEHKCDGAMIADCLDNRACSVLEMLIALSIRLEVHLWMILTLGIVQVSGFGT